jgi:hypothetical protein
MAVLPFRLPLQRFTMPQYGLLLVWLDGSVLLENSQMNLPTIE